MTSSLCGIRDKAGARDETPLCQSGPLQCSIASSYILHHVETVSSIKQTNFMGFLLSSFLTSRMSGIKNGLARHGWRFYDSHIFIGVLVSWTTWRQRIWWLGLWHLTGCAGDINDVPVGKLSGADRASRSTRCPGGRFAICSTVQILNWNFDSLLCNTVCGASQFVGVWKQDDVTNVMDCCPFPGPGHQDVTVTSFDVIN